MTRLSAGGKDGKRWGKKAENWLVGRMGMGKNLFSRCFSRLRGGNGGSDPGERARLASLQAENDRLTTELREVERHLDLIEQRHAAELAGRNEVPGLAGSGLGILVEIAIGELIDKRTILEIKLERITDPAKRANIAAECAVVTATAAPLFESNPPLHELAAALKAVNQEIRFSVTPRNLAPGPRR